MENIYLRIYQSWFPTFHQKLLQLLAMLLSLGQVSWQWNWKDQGKVTLYSYTFLLLNETQEAEIKKCFFHSFLNNKKQRKFFLFPLGSLPLVLLVIFSVERRKVTVTVGAFDGLEGNSGSMGAIIGESSLVRTEEKKISLESFLNNNDSFSVFNQLGDLLTTGHTRTNVNGIHVRWLFSFLISFI